MGSDVGMDNITDHYIWQRRIHHGVRYQKVAVPFPDSVEIGLEFNAALERKEKLDECLLTNGVMLELCSFAKTVTRSEKYFLFEILEFNFDLGVDTDDDMQYYDYATRVHSKIKQMKEQCKFKPHRLKEAFTLPEPNIIVASQGSEAPERYYPKRNKIADSSVLTDGNKNSQSDHPTTESDGAARSKLSIHRKGKHLKQRHDYPFCSEIGVTLALQPNETLEQKLDPNLMTNGVVLEMLDFSKLLCGAHTQIVYDLVKQNFGLELNKLQFSVQFQKLIERRNSSYLTEEGRDGFRKEIFTVQTKRQEQERKRKQHTKIGELETLIVASKRRKKRRPTYSDEEIDQDTDLSYMCPIDCETDVQSDHEVGPEEIKFERCSPETKLEASLDMKQEEEDVTVPAMRPQANDSPTSLLFKFQLKDNMTSRLFSEDEIKDTKAETVKQRLWMRRAPRSKQILNSSRVNDMFAHCREIGLDFNISSGNRQKLDLQLLTSWILFEISKFATAMKKSLGSFLLDILDKNFNFKSEVRQHNLMFYLMTKERILQNHPERQMTEFLNSRLHLPGVYNTTDAKPEQEHEAKQQLKEDSWSSDTSHGPDAELHPFCKKLGVNLWLTEEQPAGHKLDLSDLTVGAVLEIFSFVRELCGDVQETVNDVLEHNFDFDLQSGTTEAKQVIQKWHWKLRRLMKKQNITPKINRWLNMAIPLNNHTQLSVQPPTSNRLKDLDSVTGNVEQVKNINSYHSCEKIGLDLDVSSKLEGKTKLDLKVLTREVVFELHRYVEQNCSHYVPALYEILEFNFDLSSQSHRKMEFAWSIASQVIAMAGKTGRKGDYMKTVFELPMEFAESSQVVCKEEPEDFGEPDLNADDDIMFVRKLKPVDIEVELE